MSYQANLERNTIEKNTTSNQFRFEITLKTFL